jgi:post-segregation antitoxin (ccd killing protein)
MKAKLTVTIDEELIPKAKDQARSQGVSLSELIERALKAAAAEGRPRFSERWRGRFRAAHRKGERYRTLAKRYL